MARLSLLPAYASILCLFAVVEASSAAPLEVAEVKRDAEVDFEKEILPVFRKNCLACHSASEAQSDLVLETPQAILKGGSEGPSVVPGKSGDSLLLKLASMQKEPHMPPPDNDVKAKALTPQELGLLKLWIDQGAKGSVKSSAPIAWQPLPSGVNPIYSVAITADGQYAAASRANQVFLYHVPSRRELGRLTDPALVAGGIYKQPGVADLDLVQSLKFSPDGSLLASGGFRTVKLWRRPGISLAQEFANQQGDTQAAAVSADGQLAAFAKAGSITVVGIETGQTVATLSGHTGAVTALSFAPSGAKLVSASEDKTFRVWDVQGQRTIATIATASPVTAVALGSGGRQVLTGGRDGVLRVWEIVATQADDVARPVQELKEHTAAITALVALSGSGAGKVASASEDGTIRLWDLASGKATLFKHETPVVAIAVSADGQRLASAGRSGPARLWNLPDGKLVVDLKGNLRASIRHGEATRAAALAKKHVELAKKDLDDATKRKKDEEDNQKKAAEALTKAETEFKPKAEAAKKAAEEQASADKALAAAAAAKSAAEQIQKAAEAAISKAGEALAAARASVAAVANIDSAAGQSAKAAIEKTVAQLESLNKLLDPAKQAAAKDAAAAAEKLAAAEKQQKDALAAAQKAKDDETAAQRTLETARRSAERAAEAVQKAAAAIPGFEAQVKAAEERAKLEDAALAAAAEAAKAADKPVVGLTFAPGNNLLVTARADGQFHTWDAASGAARDAYGGTGAPISAFAAAASGKLVTAGKNKATASWRLESDWQLIRTIGSPDAPDVFADRVTALDFSPDGKTLAAGGGEPSRSGQVKLFDVGTGAQQLALTDPHSDTVNGLAFSPDGKQLASCAADRFIKLWNAADGKFIRALEGHTHHVLGVAWRADGRVLASSGADMVVKVWDARTGDQLRTVQNQFTKEVTSVSFVVDDIVVASGGDAKVRFINATSGANQRDFAGASEFVYSVAASADGKTIIAGGLDSTLRIWSDDGKEVAKFPPPAVVKDQTAAK